jgi:cytochrome c-type biogenesis protein
MEKFVFDPENVTVLSFFIAYMGGVLTSFTPCVYPLIPIIAGVIGASGERSRSRNFALSLAYVAGMALMFAFLGVLAAVTGRLFGQVQTSPVAHVVLGAIIIFFALSLAGVVPMPTNFLVRAGAGRVASGGNFFAAFVMGFFSGLVAAPCATAVVGGILAYVASTQNVVLGFSLLFVFAIGLGTVLILVGTFTGLLRSLPRSEKWMKLTEKVIALAMIALGCYFIYRAGVLSV